MTDMEQYLNPKCPRCGMDLKEIPKGFAQKDFGKLFYCQKETCPEYEKRVKIG